MWFAKLSRGKIINLINYASFYKNDETEFEWLSQKTAIHIHHNSRQLYIASQQWLFFLFFSVPSSQPLCIFYNGWKWSNTAEEGTDRWNKGHMYYTVGISDETQLLKLMLNFKFGIWKLFSWNAKIRKYYLCIAETNDKFWFKEQEFSM